MNRALVGHSGGFQQWIIVTVFALVLSACGGSGAQSSIDSGDTMPESGSQSGTNSINDMSLGEVEFLDFGSGQSTVLNFNGDASSGAFLAVIHSNNIREGDFSLTINAAGSSNVESSPTDDLDATQLAMTAGFLGDDQDQNPMHELVRAWAGVFATSPDVEVVSASTNLALALAPAASIGDTQSFRVLDSLSSISSYTEVQGRLRYAEGNLLVYVDTEMDGSADLTDADIEALADGFEQNSIPLEQNLFGVESDVNGDNTVTILMTPVLNRICLSSGIVTGFFFPGDLFARSGSNPASNEQEIFYTLVPNPSGSFCRSLGVEFTLDNILPGVLAHEYQHMISFNQHVLVNGGSTEESWLNEGLSHLAEDLTGYGQENPSRVNLFLNSANSTTLIPSGLPSLSERGMSYMFMRYLYEQSDDPTRFLNRLLDTNEVGADNIVAAFDGLDPDLDEFSEFYSNWQVALVLTGTGITDDERYTYQDRAIDPETGNFTGVCLFCDPEDGRGTILSGPSLSVVSNLPTTLNLESAGGQYFQLLAPGQELTISGSQGANLGGALIRLEDR